MTGFNTNLINYLKVELLHKIQISPLQLRSFNKTKVKLVRKFVLKS